MLCGSICVKFKIGKTMVVKGVTGYPCKQLERARKGSSGMLVMPNF